MVQLNHSETIPDFILENIRDVSLRILKGAKWSVCYYAASHSPCLGYVVSNLIILSKDFAW